MKKSEKLISAILTAVIGVLFIVYGNQIIKTAIVVLGVAIIVASIFDLANKFTRAFIVKAIIGVLIIIFGVLFFSVAIYVLAAALLIFGVLQLYNCISSKRKVPVWYYVGPIITIVVSLCLLINQSGTIDYMFIVAGVLLIIEGVLELVECLTAKK